MMLLFLIMKCLKKMGWSFSKQLKGQNCEIPFILFTGKGREEVAIKALNLGAQGYYNKQGSPETVYGELSHGISERNEHAAERRTQPREHDGAITHPHDRNTRMVSGFGIDADRA